ncbi:MAG: hypothetical protein UU57_C0013G0001, partial [Candidatus Woesebacteria bacterium GW2011_GWE1_41_24]
CVLSGVMITLGVWGVFPSGIGAIETLGPSEVSAIWL